MKKVLLVLCLLLTSAAFGQVFGSYISSEPQVYHAPEHPAHASYAPLAEEHGIVGGGNASFAHGDRPPSDFPQMAATPLGDTARELKKQHARVRKARVVWEN